MALRRGAWRAIAIGLFTAAAASAVGFNGPASAAPVGEIGSAGKPAAVAGSYLVTLKDGTVGAAGTSSASAAVPTKAAGLARTYGGSVQRTYSAALTGFHITMSESAAKRLAADPAVAFVEQDQVVSISATQNNATWGIDRIDQRNRPLSTTYTYPNTASNVHAYIIDTGILVSHTQFGGRATNGRDFVDNDAIAGDCHGHGTHVAGTVGGSLYGVAKAVRLVAVRVLNCVGDGTLAGVIAGIDWVTANAIKPAVANMSLGGDASTTLDNAVNNSINSGVTYAIAAGNDTVDACTASPARVANAITVGATTSTDARSSFSNFGSCLDIFAPGSLIKSAWPGTSLATNTISGTSMASPHVAGAAALVLSANPSFTPAQVRDFLVNNATTDVVTSPGTGSPNRLLFVVN